MLGAQQLFTHPLTLKDDSYLDFSSSSHSYGSPGTRQSPLDVSFWEDLDRPHTPFTNSVLPLLTSLSKSSAPLLLPLSSSSASSPTTVLAMSGAPRDGTFQQQMTWMMFNVSKLVNTMAQADYQPCAG